MSNKRFVLSAIASILLLVAVYLLRSPAQEGPWREGQQRPAKVELLPDKLVVHDLRDFRYDATGAATQTTYRDAHYETRRLARVWYGLSHFAEHGLAHAFLSFEFLDEQGQPDYLVASIEARLRPDQSYNPLLGLFRAYPRIVVLGTEADIIGLRTHARKERVLLYPLKLTADQRESLFRAVMTDADSTYNDPTFYNTALDNCATGILQYSAQWHSILTRIDHRVLLPGYSDELAHAYGYLDAAGSLEQLRQRAEIAVDEIATIDASYSKEIRKNWNDLDADSQR